MLVSLLAISSGAIALIVILAVAVLLVSIFCLTRLKKCPQGKIMVVYGLVKTSNGVPSKYVFEGKRTFIIPVVQNYAFLDLAPMTIGVDLKKDLSIENVRVDAPSRFTFAISTEEEFVKNATERLLGLSEDEVQSLAKAITLGGFRSVVENLGADEISDKDKFIEEVSKTVKSDLKLIGLKLLKIQTISGMDKEV